MDSDDDNGFARKGGEALDLGEGEEFSDSEEDDDAPPMRKPMPQTKNTGTGNNVRKPDPRDAAKGGQVKGQKVDNQPFDLAVDVNDSEEIESDEEEDEVNVDMNVAQKRPEQKPQQL